MKDLWTIVILYRQPDTMSLYGIPYGMRADVGQQPRDLDRPERRDGWIWLGTPGWWGSMSPGRQRAVQAYLEPLQGIIPTGPAEWDYVETAVERFRSYAKRLHRDADTYADHFRIETPDLRAAARICERYARNYSVPQK